MNAMMGAGFPSWHGGKIGVLQEYWSMGCQETLRSKFPLKQRPALFLHAPILLLTAHAMQRERGKKRFNVVELLLLLFGVLCAMVRFLVVFMVSTKDKTYSLHNCTQFVFLLDNFFIRSFLRILKLCILLLCIIG